MQCHVKDTLVADGDDFGILQFLSWSFEVGSLLHELSIPMKLTYYGGRVDLPIWKWLSDKLEVSFMKKSVQLSSRSNNPPTFLIQVFGNFRVERWVLAKMILHQDLFWGILHYPLQILKKFITLNFLRIEI